MDINKINELCLERGITILQLSKKIGMSNSFYTTLKSGSLKVETLEKIAAALEVPVTVFFENSYSDELQKKELEVSKKLILQLESNYNNLKLQNDSLKELSEAREMLSSTYYNIICMLFADIHNLYLESDSYIAESIFRSHPEIEDNEDRTILEKYKSEDRLRIKFISLLKKIRPMIKGEIEFRINSIEEII